MAITISGENNNDRILASDGVIDSLSGLNVVGVITATSFTGDFTGDVTGNLTGNVTGNINNSTLLLQTGGSERIRITGNNEIGIAGANYGSAGQVLTSGGSGSAVSWTTIAAQANISNNADNRVITGGSGVNLNGEANLTFDGTSLRIADGGKLGVNGAVPQTPLDVIANSSGYAMAIRGRSSDNIGEIRFTSNDYASALYSSIQTGPTYLNIQVGSTANALRIDSSGRLIVGASAAVNNGIAEFHRDIGGGAEGCHILVKNTSTNSVNNTARLKLETSGGTAQFYAFATGITELRSRVGGTADWKIRADGASNIRFFTDDEERLRITNTGQFKVGNNPTAASGTFTHIEAPTAFNSGETIVQIVGNSTTTGPRLNLQNRNTGASASSEILGSDSGGQSTTAIRFYHTNQSDNYGEIAFATRNQSGVPPEDRLRIHANGRIEPKYSSSAGATGGIIMVGAFCAQPSAHSSQEGKVQAKTNTNVNTFDASGWYDNTNYRYNPKVKGHYIFFGTGMMYTGMNGSSVEQSVYFVKNDSAGSGSVPQYASGYSTNYGNYDLQHITNCIYMNGTTDYVHFHLSSSVSPKLHSASMWQGFLLYPAA